MFKKRFGICFLTFFLASILSFQGYLCADEEAVEQLKQASKGFSYVAKKVTPSVVSIEAHFSANHLPQGEDGQRRSPDRRNGSQDPFDLFTDEFFKHFFGSQRPGLREQQPDQLSNGSGYLISDDGYILTNSHVVHNAKKIIVTLEDGIEHEAQLTGADPGTDVAVIKIEGKHFPALKFSDSDSLEVGEWVIAVGTPLGLRTSVTAGILSAKGRSNLQITDFDDLLQTDAAINPGNSGGPLVNLNGEVVGMNTAIATKSGGYMGIGFAIPSNMVRHVKEQIIETGSVTRGFLGIAPQDLTTELADSFGFDGRAGVLVAQIVPESPAALAGVVQGDIIIEINHVVMKDTSTLRKTVALMDPGAMTTLLVFREGETIEVQVTLSIHPESPSQEVNKIFDWLGFQVIELSVETAKELGYQVNEGVLVSEVTPGSPAALAGVEVGNLILTVERKEIHSLADFTDVIKGAVEDGRVLILLKKGRGRRFVSLSLEE